MDLITLVLLALGLSADAFAVAITNGMCSSKITKQHAVATGLAFGFFQALMPVLGFILGRTFSDFVCRFQHWIALILLGAIGINMLVDTFKEWKSAGTVSACSTRNIFSVKNLLIQAVATSIDALAAGVSIAVLNIHILYAALLIGLITFVLCTAGVYIGKSFGSLLGLRAKVAGGVVLLFIGLKIFTENQFM
ncbi:putative Mn2+ efflux pump MntP [Anaerotaenia torta]|uniref:manganese efflux pump MntP n=1 Tax=Anaerotaenia torta TaxID=433293 RepID=UPI003D23BCC8